MILVRLLSRVARVYHFRAFFDLAIIYFCNVIVIIVVNYKVFKTQRIEDILADVILKFVTEYLELKLYAFRNGV